MSLDSHTIYFTVFLATQSAFLSLILLMSTNRDYSCVRDETFGPQPPASNTGRTWPSLVLFSTCAPAWSGGGGRSQTFHSHWKYRVTAAIFRMTTNAKINTASGTCWTFALVHCLRIFQGDPCLLIFPNGVQQAGPESHMHCCHHELGLWPGTKWLCLAGASPCPRAVHDVMDAVVSSRVLCSVNQFW